MAFVQHCMMWQSIDLLQKTFKVCNTDTREAANIELENKEEVLRKIDYVIFNVIKQISSGKPPVLTYTSRTTWDNIKFHEDMGLTAQDQCKMTAIKFGSQQSVKKFNLMLKILAIMYRLVQTNKYCTKRDIYYQDPSGFGSQSSLDEAVDSISCMLQTPRWRLHVLATSKGCIAGNLSFQDADGNFVDCRQTRTGILVPARVMEIKHFQTNAKVILVVEKDATFQKLLDDGIVDKLEPCILITGKGFPDVNTRMLLHRLWAIFHLPIMALVDADPHGIEIMSIYKYGSRSLSHETSHLAVPSMKWLGVLPSDIKRLRIDSSALIALTKSDYEKASELLSRPYVSHPSSLQQEIEILQQIGYKAEIQCLDSISSSFLTDVYLPGKLQNGGWI